MIDVRRATADDEAAVAATLGRAFLDDPLVMHLLGPAAGDLAVTTRFLGLAVEHLYLPKGESWTVDGCVAAALWAPPGKWETSPDAATAIAGPMAQLVGDAQIGASLSAFGVIEAVHPTEPHWYLATLGTDPDWQGRGLGTAVMQPVLERCDADGIPAYLESSKERNIPLYERHGFRTLERLDLPDGPPVWPMWREPSSG